MGIQTGRPKAELLFSTVWQNKGPINLCTVMDCFMRLQDFAPEEISFYLSGLDDSVWSGVCTAHCLSFLSLYLRSYKYEALIPNRGNEPTFQSLDDRIIRCLNSCPSDTEIRTYQAALNCIGLHDEYIYLFQERGMEHKITSLCALKGLKVETTSANEIDYYTKSDLENKKAFFEVYDNMKPGAYLIRAISEAYNEKGEYYGHSMVIIKDEAGAYFFDPSSQGGLVYFDHSVEKEYLYDCISYLCQFFKLNYPRFYGVKAMDWILRPRIEKEILCAVENLDPDSSINVA